ncbi:hypothetical protein GOODEAATRI_033976 [Goodea atripinnis]|uniref:Maturase K n=1 Tax=Goodea atripinnis TaxID=208336 RepID=A0ABV0PJD4_9TELE
MIGRSTSSRLLPNYEKPCQMGFRQSLISYRLATSETSIFILISCIFGNVFLKYFEAFFNQLTNHYNELYLFHFHPLGKPRGSLKTISRKSAVLCGYNAPRPPGQLRGEQAIGPVGADMSEYNRTLLQSSAILISRTHTSDLHSQFCFTESLIYTTLFAAFLSPPPLLLPVEQSASTRDDHVIGQQMRSVTTRSGPSAHLRMRKQNHFWIAVRCALVI